jgi:hypothetical protein
MAWQWFPDRQVRTIKQARIMGTDPDGRPVYQVIEDEWTMISRRAALAREWRALLAELGQAWYEWHKPSRAWWLMACRAGFWYAIRFVRVSQPTEPSAELVELAARHPGKPVVIVTRLRAPAVRLQPWWCPGWLFRIAYPEPKVK